jgi:deoxyribonuclease I
MTKPLLNKCSTVLIFCSLIIIMSISLNQNSWADQTSIYDYNEAKDIFWTLDYNQNSKTIYCNKPFTNKSGLNIEHVFAAAWMKQTSGCGELNRKQCRSKSRKFNHMEGDLHNLFPESTKINSMRGNLPFTILNGKSDNSCDLEVESYAIEPSESSRGQIARALLYMSLEYNVDLDEAAESPGMLELIKSWHCKYPVQQVEINRNQIIFSVQNTENPYVTGKSKVDCSTTKVFPED